MRFLFLIFILLSNYCFAQQYHLQEVYKNPHGRSAEIWVTIKKVGDLGKDRAAMQMDVSRVEYKKNDLGEDKLIFSSSDPQKNLRPVSTSTVLEYFYLLSYPVYFEVHRGRVFVDTLRLTKEIDQRIKPWQLKEDILPLANSNIIIAIKDLAQQFFLPVPANINLKRTKGWKDTTSTEELIVNGRNRKFIDLSTKDSAGPQRSIRMYTSMQIIEENISVNQKIISNGVETMGSYEKDISPAEDFEHVAADTAYFNMLVRGSFLSNALTLDNNFDSTLLSNYIARYEPLYQNDKSFLSTKLNGIQKLGNYTLYRNEIRKISPRLLAGSHHLSNKMDALEMSDQHFEEAVSLLSKRDLNSWLQISFSQDFLAPSPKEILLKRLRDLAYHDSISIRNASRPLYLWVIANKNKTNSDSIRFYADELLKLGDEEWDWGNAGRYSLLLYQTLDKNTSPEYAANYLPKVINRLKPLYENENNQLRFVQKAHISTAYYLQSQTLLQSDSAKALKMLEKAAFYSPKDAKEKAHQSNYDRYFLKSKENYTEEYLALLAVNGKPDLALQEYVTEFIGNQGNAFEGLKNFYEQNFPTEKFGVFFNEKVLTKLEDAPSFELLNMQDQNYSSKTLSGKWTLIDFWGTWCGPCVAEMPEINKFYNELKEKNNPNLQFISIACYDTKAKVENFLETNNYNIPVLLSDGKVQQDFKVTGYPIKILISPKGKLLRMDFGFSWKKFAEELSEL